MDRGAAVRNHLFSLTARGIKYDLERMAAAAEACGNPQNAYPCFHVAGTNGKGSTCSYLESALRSCGHKTGLFTSPHLIRFEERFAINGRPIDETVWLEAYHGLQPVIEKLRLTFFEASTLLAFEIFKRQNVEWAVFETGLGGRLDATNILIPRVSIITRIAMDHMEYLGNDLLLIAAEKLGIVKQNVPLVMAEPALEAIRSLAVKRCEESGSPCHLVAAADASSRVIDSKGASFTWDNTRFRINLAGDYQVVNALLALSALKAAGFGDKRTIAKGLEKAWLPGRFHVIAVRNRPTAVFDVGHNPDAVQAFCRSLQNRFTGKPVCFVIGIMKDKDIAGMMRQYAALARRFICTAPATERAARPEDISARVPREFSGECRAVHGVAAAVETAFKGPEEIVCIAGSFFTVGEAMVYLNIDPYKK